MLFVVGAVVLQGEPPAYDASLAEVRRFFTDNHTRFLVGDYLAGLAFLLLFLPFVVGLRSLLGTAEGGPPRQARRRPAHRPFHYQWPQPSRVRRGAGDCPGLHRHLRHRRGPGPGGHALRPVHALGWIAVALNLLLGSGFAYFQLIEARTRSATPD